MKNYLTLFFIALLLYPNVSLSQPGTIDTSFGNNGAVKFPAYGSENDWGNSIALQSDGKIIVAGYGGNNDFVVVRFNSDGTIDSTFGLYGKVMTDVDGYDYADAVAVQSDGKILVAGTCHPLSFDVGIVRYNSNGSLDNTFNGDGIVEVDMNNGSDDGVFALAVQQDGKIIATGYSQVGLVSSAIVLRFNMDGTPDTTFGTDGMIITPSATADAGAAIVIQPDAKIIIAGGSNNGTDNDISILRFNAEGIPDSSFGINGVVTTDVNDEVSRAMVLQPDGKILVAGSLSSFPSGDFLLVAYNSDGTPDTSFGSAGKVITDFDGNYDFPYSMALQQDGKIVLAGYTENLQNYTYTFAVVRYNDDGTPDSLFGSSGKVTTFLGTDKDIGYAVAIQTDGKILVAGSSGGINQNSQIAVVRYLSDIATGVAPVKQSTEKCFVFPDPVYSDFMIYYSLQEDQRVTLLLYNVNGRIVQSFVNNEFQREGNHFEQLKLNPSMSRGNYFLSITRGSSLQVIPISKQ